MVRHGMRQSAVVNRVRVAYNQGKTDPKKRHLEIEHIKRVKRDRGYKPYILNSHSDEQRVREFARAKRKED